MEPTATQVATVTHLKCIDLSYLRRITKSNPGVMTKMMVLYLRQVPPLILSLRKGFNEQDWKTVFHASHQLIPSFAIMGIGIEFEAMSKRIQQSAGAGHSIPEMHGMISQLEEICTIACQEIESELRVEQTV